MASAEVIPASAAEARDLTDRIKVAVDGTWQLIKHAYEARAWAALGYRTWDEYCAREFGTARLRLPREERQEVVASLREIGMSTRAIAAATGDSDRTVRRELASRAAFAARDADERDMALAQAREAADNGQRIPLAEASARVGIDEDGLDDETEEPEPEPEPRHVIGTDGKRYTQPARPSAPQRPALPPQFQSAAADLTRVIARLERLRDDDRYRANRPAIADRCTPELRRATQVLQKLLSDLGHENGTSP